MPIIIQDGKPIESSIDKAELFADIFESVSSDNNNTPEFIATKATTERENGYLFDINSSTDSDVSTCCLNDNFNTEELQRAIRRAKSDSAPGKDRVSFTMLQRLPKSAIKIILKFYNIVWHKGTIPLDFKHGIIFPILKPNKSIQEATSYRPICLTSCLEKIMERMVTDRLTYYSWNIIRA